MGSTALVTLISGNAAFAEVTPEDVWTMWKDYSASYGQTMVAESEERDGDTLVVSGVTVTVDDPSSKFELTIDEINFTDNGDGTVSVSMSDEAPMTISMTEPEATEPTEIEVMLRQADLDMTVSGTVDEMRVDYAVPEVNIALTEVNGVDSEKVDLTVDFTLTEVAGSSITKGTTDKASTGNFGAKSMAFNVAAKDAEKGGVFNMAGTLADLAGSSSTNTVANVDMSDLSAALRAGFAVDGAFTYGKGDLSFDFVEGEQTAKGTGTTEGGSLNVVMNKDSLGYGGGAKSVAVVVSGSDIPFPELKVSYAESAFNFKMPIAKSDTPSEFAMLTKITDLAISDEIWGMFDPTGMLPHDPMTLLVDTKGTAKLNVDIMDPKAMEAAGGAAPGELNSLDVTALNLKVAGAEVTGSGALTFDNTDLVTFEGVPAPTGKIDLKVTGANTLMDNLAKMGLIPEDQLMGARMMLGMFAKVDETAPDTMTSTLEFKDKGFFANGMQLK